MRVTIRVEGLLDTKKAVRMMREALSDAAVTEIVADGVEPVASSAQHYAPRVSGALADSIEVSTSAIDPEGVDDVEVYVGPTDDVEYALPVEVGTPDGVRGPGQYFPGTAPHPYLRPAFDEGADRALQDIGQALINRALEAGSS